jgi:polyvinyl alcohol dehydrogenase (cytochrome)
MNAVGKGRWIGAAYLTVAAGTLAGISSCGTGYAQPAGEDQAAEFPTLTADSEEGTKLFAERCAACHDHARGNIPPAFVLAYKPPEVVIGALTTGKMKPQAVGLTAEQIRAIAIHVTHREPGTTPDPDMSANRCAAGTRAGGLAFADWNGVGKDVRNSRYQAQAGLTPDQARGLILRWVFAYPGGNAYGQPVVVNGVLYLTTAVADVVALDPSTGCTLWTSKMDAPVRTAIFVASAHTDDKTSFGYFGDEKAAVYALDLKSGARAWKTQVDTHPTARIVGSPVLYKGTVYVPVSSMDEGSAYDPNFECCKFRGKLVALNASTGVVKWETFMISQPAVSLGQTNSSGTPMYGPAGAAIWAAPTIDAKRNLVYVSTGNGYNVSEAGDTNAVVALDADTGERRWAVQPVPSDDPYTKCKGGVKSACELPEVKQTEYGQKVPERMEFGSSGVLAHTKDGKDLIIVGQKSGVVYALDPDRKGAVVWQARVGQGGLLGGVMYGPAVDDRAVYISVADRTAKPPHVPGGLTALSLADGRRLWRTDPAHVVCAWGEQDCSGAQPGATTAIPGVVFSGALDGHIRAYSADTGIVVWDFDTGRTFDAVNGVKGHGGAINGYSQIVSGGFLYVNSGSNLMTHPGNILLAFSTRMAAPSVH